MEVVEDSEINKANGWKLYGKDKSGNLVEAEYAQDAKVIKTDKLVKENIAGFEVANNETPRYKDVQVELIVNENEIKAEDRIITNIAEIESSKLEPNSNNDKSEENNIINKNIKISKNNLQVKEFDLNVTKYIKEITLKDNEG